MVARPEERDFFRLLGVWHVLNFGKLCSTRLATKIDRDQYDMCTDVARLSL